MYSQAEKKNIFNIQQISEIQQKDTSAYYLFSKVFFWKMFVWK